MCVIMQKNFKYLVNGGPTELSLSLVVWHLPCFCLSHQPRRQLLLEMCMNSEKNPPSHRASILSGAWLACAKQGLTSSGLKNFPYRAVSQILWWWRGTELEGRTVGWQETFSVDSSGPRISIGEGLWQQSGWKMSGGLEVALTWHFT